MSRILFSEGDTLVINPKLAKLIGLNEAIILQQIHYWIDNKYCAGHIHLDRKWIYNTVSQWHEQFPFISVSTIKRVMVDLRDKGLIDVQKLSKDGLNHTNYYTINYESLDAMRGQIEQIDRVNLNQPNGSDWSKPNRTETTTKTTEPRKRVSSAKKTLSQYLEQCEAEKRKPIPDDHCSRKYAADAGISPEMIALAWFSFVDTYRDGTGKAKKYADWGLAFNNAVKGNWAKLWYVARDSGTVNWTSEGLLYKATIDAKLGNS